MEDDSSLNKATYRTINVEHLYKLPLIQGKKNPSKKGLENEADAADADGLPLVTDPVRQRRYKQRSVYQVGVITGRLTLKASKKMSEKIRDAWEGLGPLKGAINARMHSNRSRNQDRDRSSLHHVRASSIPNWRTGKKDGKKASFPEVFMSHDIEQNLMVAATNRRNNAIPTYTDPPTIKWTPRFDDLNGKRDRSMSRFIEMTSWNFDIHKRANEIVLIDFRETHQLRSILDKDISDIDSEPFDLEWSSREEYVHEDAVRPNDFLDHNPLVMPLSDILAVRIFKPEDMEDYHRYQRDEAAVKKPFPNTQSEHC